jgi:hypothetical protein
MLKGCSLQHDPDCVTFRTTISGFAYVLRASVDYRGLQQDPSLWHSIWCHFKCARPCHALQVLLPAMNDLLHSQVWADWESDLTRQVYNEEAMQAFIESGAQWRQQKAASTARKAAADILQ